MKSAAAYIILFSILVNTLGQTILLANYVLNKSYYATVLCENKAKPQMHCEGKCHLKKELKKQSEEEKNPTAAFKVKTETIQLFQQLSQFSFTPDNEIKIFRSFISIGKITSASFSIFQPPRA